MNGTTVACEAAALEVVVGDRHVPVAPTRRFVLGRGTDVDLVLNHPRVSRRHLVLEHGPPAQIFEDPQEERTRQFLSRIRQANAAEQALVSAEQAEAATAAAIEA